jgi:hypothetical protein
VSLKAFEESKQNETVKGRILTLFGVKRKREKTGTKSSAVFRSSAGRKGDLMTK